MRLCLALLLLVPLYAHAACSGSSPNRTAASASATDVTACLAVAVNGDTINVPAGSATWDSINSVVISGLNVKLVGATTCSANAPGTQVTSGCWTDSTNITLNGTNGSMSATCSTANYVDISGFTFIIQNGLNNGQLYITGPQFAQNCFRFHLNHLKIPVSTSGGTILAVVGVYGLIDHVWCQDLDTGNPEHCVDFYGANPGTDAGYAAWNQASTLGTINAVYMEDSLISWNGVEEALDSFGGARWVFRYSSQPGGFLSNHGTDSGNYRSTVSVELYNLTVSTGWGMTYRGGTGVVHDVTYTSGGVPANILLEIFRANNAGTSCSIASAWQTCNGTAWYPSGNSLGVGNSGTSNNSSPVVGTSLGFCTHNLDQWEPYNNGAGNAACAALFGGDTATGPFDPSGGTGYACRDQPGRGHNQVAQPIYSWNVGNSVVIASDTCSASYLTAGTDFVNNGTTVKPGYTAYTYPHPLQGAVVVTPPPAPAPAFTMKNQFCVTVASTKQKICCKSAKGTFDQPVTLAAGLSGKFAASNCFNDQRN